VGIFKIQSIERVIEWSQKQGEQLYSASKGVGTKISSFVLQSIRGEAPKSEGIRKPTNAKILDPSKSALKTLNPLDQNKEKSFLYVSSLSSPIGLHACPNCSWVNAWVQFVMYLPRFLEFSSSAGKGFDPFYLFLSQYLFDQREGRSISSANSSIVFQSLQQSMDPSFEGVHLEEVTSSFFKEIFPFSGKTSSSLFFRTDWIVMLDEKIQEKLDQLYKKSPLEILIGGPLKVNSNAFLVQWQLFPKKENFYYDLNSFIEARLGKAGFVYVTYIKLGRVWYQCENETVQTISSTMIDIPLQRGVLFYYKQMIL
jgi:hypothetical protein